jgi:hypothetical protein
MCKVSARFHVLFVCIVLLCGGLPAGAQCKSNSGHELSRDGRWFWHGVMEAPRNAIRPQNLKWELPIGVATGVLIGAADTPASRAIQSASIQHQATRWTDIGLGLELGASGVAFVVGCAENRESLRSTAQVALEAAGAATVVDQLIKHATNRQRPFQDNASGELWEGGRSFPSGHAATSFAIASAVAHRQSQHRWIKWTAYALAAGVSLGRYPAKQHFFSDILVGGTLGYVTGTYLAAPHGAQ